jgi:hypothetical protein
MAEYTPRSRRTVHFPALFGIGLALGAMDTLLFALPGAAGPLPWIVLVLGLVCLVGGLLTYAL